jgi:hypothetical protein
MDVVERLKRRCGALKSARRGIAMTSSVMFHAARPLGLTVHLRCPGRSPGHKTRNLNNVYSLLGRSRVAVLRSCTALCQSVGAQRFGRQRRCRKSLALFRRWRHILTVSI